MRSQSLYYQLSIASTKYMRRGFWKSKGFFGLTAHTEVLGQDEVTAWDCALCRLALVGQSRRNDGGKKENLLKINLKSTPTRMPSERNSAIHTPPDITSPRHQDQIKRNQVLFTIFFLFCAYCFKYLREFPAYGPQDHWRLRQLVLLQQNHRRRTGGGIHLL